MVFSAVALLCLGLVSAQPAAAAPGAWQCMSPAFACGDAPSVKRHRSRQYAGDREWNRKTHKRSSKRASNKVSKPAVREAAKAVEAKTVAKSDAKAKEKTIAKVDVPERKLASIGQNKPAAKAVGEASKESNYRVRSTQSGIASYYWQPQRVASGGYFNPNALTAAHRSLPFGTKVRVTNKRNGKSVVVTINDRGPFVRGRVIDLSKAAAGVIGMQGAGLAPVVVERLAAN
jgi:rare lipoprotein A